MKLISAVCLLFLALSASATPRNTAFEFKIAALSALANQCSNQQKSFYSFCYRSPIDIEKIRFVATDKPLRVQVDGVFQDCSAVNEPLTNTIYIQRQKWEALTDIHERESLALHEVLSLIGWERTGSYSVSAGYYSFWQLGVAETPLDIALNRSLSPRTVVSDYNKFKTLFFSSVYDDLPVRYSNRPLSTQCLASIASQDPGIPDKVFPITIRRFEHDGKIAFEYFTKEPPAIPFGFKLKENNSLPTLQISGQNVYGNATEYTQTFESGDGREVLRIRASDSLAVAYKLEVYNNEELALNLFAICGADLCQNYITNFYASPACPSPRMP